MAHRKITSAAQIGEWTLHGKQLIARSMYEKGRAFLRAALLLKEQDGYEYVVLHLICQGIEVLGKGYLLMEDYDRFKPQLRSYGHDLIKLVADIESQAKVRVLTPFVRAELEPLNRLYKGQLLRYGSGYDILVNAKSVPHARVLRRLAALLRLREPTKSTQHQ